MAICYGMSSVLMEKIMGVKMAVGLTVMVMDMLMDQVDLEQEFFVIKDFISRTDRFDPVFFRKNGDTRMEF
jgi:hypothetical protein